ncbi:hypothetical protein PI172_1934 [Prevotella intermedia]|uniref:Uncharacterized protein n=1 Tax=Prevotella intermedia TaxID=28131 RepID=A0AAD1BLZ8_PREIN|nr:hypothetical protein PI172_1934 [Prevotella intermedia]
MLKEEPNMRLPSSLCWIIIEMRERKGGRELTQKLLESKKTEKETKMALLRQVIIDNQQSDAKDSLK